MHGKRTICKLAMVLALLVIPKQGLAASLNDVQAEVFTPSCAISGCHDGSWVPNLSVGAYENIVNVNANLAPALFYINPGDPDNSFLIQKIQGSSLGLSMPLGGTLTASQIQLVSDWVTEGALQSANNDSDADGISDSTDNCVSIANADQLNTDNDSEGDACDDDDDNDGVTDANDAFPTDATKSIIDSCDDTSITGSDAATSSLAYETRLAIANPGSNQTQQSFLRFVNPNDVTTSVAVYGIDDDGSLSRKGPFIFTLAPQASKQISAQDIENGNTAKGLSSNLCDGTGKWQLRIRSDNPIEALSLIRTPDGFLTSVHDVVPSSGNNHTVNFANPASNVIQATFLRVVNLTANTSSVTIIGIDDNGITSSGTVTFILASNQSKQMNMRDLENGNTSKGLTGKGLTGSLGNGTGKWRLNVTSSLDLQVMSLIRTPDGFVTNLSSMVDTNDAGKHIIYFANPATETVKTTFLRIINTTNQTGTITISGIDDTGNVAPNGVVTFELGALAAKQMTVSDLENGNTGKGLIGTLGDGTGRWQLTVSADVTIDVMSLIRTPDGFLTNLSSTTPMASG